MATTTDIDTHYYLDRGLFVEPACGTTRPGDTVDMHRKSADITCEDCKETAEGDENYDGPAYSDDRY